MRATAAACVLLALAAMPARAQDVLVHAAASLTDALREAAAAHGTRTGASVRLNLGASSALARQVLEGAPGDVFVAADEAQMDRLEEAGLLLPGTRRSLLSNSLVVVVPAASTATVTSTADLASDAIAKVALAETSSVPAGVYAREHLVRAGLWERVRPKVVPTENVRGALAAVASGNVDAAIVYATDARASQDVRVACAIAPGQVPPVSYPVAVLAGSRDPAAARALVAWLESPEADALFARHGFLTR